MVAEAVECGECGACGACEVCEACEACGVWLFEFFGTRPDEIEAQVLDVGLTCSIVLYDPTF